jgi:sortase (surface protein transpeptidase)
MRALRRCRRLKRLAALAAVCAVAVIVATTVFVSRDTQASGFPSSPSASIVTTTSVTLPPTTATTAVALTSTTAAASTTSTAPSTTTTTIYLHAIADPARIVIPAIKVDAKVIQVGLLDNGDMQVPSFGLAGWYKLGPAPGAGGPAVIVAHVDSKKGPDVFYRLKELEPGDEVTVYGKDGDTATFAVDSREQQPKKELPADRIWNDTWEPVIRLITCGGDFDRDWGHYLANVIVYGHLVK